MPLWLYAIRDVLQMLLLLVQVMGALVAMCVPLVAGGAAIVGWMSYRQRRIADNRAEWWRRASYALDLTKIQEPELGRNTGMELLTRLQEDESVGQTERDLLKGAIEVLLDEIVRSDRGITSEARTSDTLTSPPSKEAS